jgi:hypothetical protein
MNELRVLPLKTQEEVEELMSEVHKTGHLLMHPTHVVKKCGEVVGGFSLHRQALGNFWMHPEKAQIRDSLIAINVAENILTALGGNILTVVCHQESPFRSMIGRIGYASAGSNFDIMYKLLS